MNERDYLSTPVWKPEFDDLKVTIFSESSLSYAGGGERLILLIHDYLRSKNIESRIVENINKPEYNSTLQQNLDLNIVGVTFERFGFIKFLYQNLPPLEKISSDESEISLIFLRRVPPRSILRQLEKFNPKVIFCLHGIALERIRITNPIIIAHQLLMRIQLGYLVRYTRNHIFIQSLLPPLTSYLVKCGANSNNIFTIENQLESELFFPQRNDEEFQVTFVGRMEELQKGIKRLKKVMLFVQKSGKNIKFNIIGKGRDIEILQGSNLNVKILNGIDDQRKNKIIASSNLAIVTSNLEPYPLVVLEFLTSGVPVVSTPASGPAYIISKDQSFGKVVSFSAKLLAETIVGYYLEWEKDKELYFSQRKDLYYRARKMFKTKNMLDSYMNMIVQVRARK